MWLPAAAPAAAIAITGLISRSRLQRRWPSPVLEGHSRPQLRWLSPPRHAKRVLPHFRCKWSVVVACRLGRRYSRGVKKAAAKQVEFGAAVRLPLEQFQPVDLAFDGTIAPRLRQGSPNRRKVANNSGNEAVQRRGSRRGQPNLERRRIPLAQNAAEFIDCRRRGADLGYESS